MLFGQVKFFCRGRDVAESGSAIEFCNRRDHRIRVFPFRLSDADKFERSCGGGFRNAFRSEMLDHSSIELHDDLLIACRLLADRPLGPRPLDP